MPISFAKPIDLNCPECGTNFAAELWLIVAVDERPDLVESNCLSLH